GVTARFRTSREIRRLKREVMLNPHNAQAQSDLGRNLVRVKRYQEGISCLEEAVGKMSDIPETRFYLGVGYLNVGELEKARTHLEAAIELDPRYGYGEAYLRLGDLNMLEKNLDSALASYEAFTGIHTSSSEGYYKLGEVWLARGDAGKARDQMKKAVAAFRGSPPHKKRIDRPWYWKARAKIPRLRPSPQ
ncbi:MAG: tetratricopeptide repeat protein, partial [bacterium]|nr:tetratricopeptide repeat protein [bacterium]